ncbi:MAG: AAA family ATPase [Gammaproteobacteria bacterium]|nr:AAA family ATPase [Gammaproteobacteria bacterium]
MTNIKDEQRIHEFDTNMLDEQIGNEPFFDAPPEFEVSHSQNIIDKLIHLSRFGNLLTLVVGNNGCGKTKLLDKLLSTVDDDCQICHIKAQPLLSIDQLFQQVMESFAEQNTFTGIPLTANQYEEWAEQLIATTDNRLLIIDDAEVLSTSVLHELCQLSAMQQDKETPHLHLILFGNYDLNVILEQSAQGILDEDGIYVIDIPSLSEAESKSWFEYILSTLDIDFLPEQDVLDDILQKDDGNLSLLKESAEEFAAENQDVLTVEEEIKPLRISVVGYWFGIFTIVILCVFGMFFFQDEIADLIGLGKEKSDTKDQEVQIIKASKESLDIETTQEVAIEEQQIIETISPDVENDGNSALENNTIIEEVVVQQPVVQEMDAEPNEDVGMLDNTEENTDLISDKPYVIEAPIAVTPDDAPESVKEKSVANNMTEDEQYLISLPDNNYTVQLIGLSKESSIQAFIAKHNFKDVYYYRSSLNEKLWFIIVLKSYANKNDAASARANLPAELIKNGPWIKSLKTIKNEIRAAQELIRE